jgi:hypothetical protein
MVRLEKFAEGWIVCSNGERRTNVEVCLTTRIKTRAGEEVWGVVGAFERGREEKLFISREEGA